MTDTLRFRFLRQGGQTVADVAGELAAFLGQARHDVAIAIYDFRFDADGGGGVVAETLQDLARRGVHVRICDHDDRVKKRERELPEVTPTPPPPPEYVDALGLDVRPVTDFLGLMHDKFVVVDGTHVWTGSPNWTDDAFTLQENAICTIESREIAAEYARVFEELWDGQKVEGTGDFEPAKTELVLDGQRVVARPFFCPGRGPEIAGRIASAVRRARERVLVCSPVLTSGPILGALADVLDRPGLSVRGVVDGTQMRSVLRQWATDRTGAWKPAAYEAIAERASFSRKRSIPWAPGRPHDYLHAKIMICDDVAFVGSYNHSRSGEENAENVLVLQGAAAADRLAAFVEEQIERYRDDAKEER